MTDPENYQEQFDLHIKAILVEPEGGGSFKEVIDRPDGTTVTYSFSHAVAMFWQDRSSNYVAAIGVIPDWVLLCHPYQRASLCDLALDWNWQLPPVRPISSSDDAARYASITQMDEPVNADKKRARKPNPITDTIRTEIMHAAETEAIKAAYKLSGRGHEPRVTLDRALAQIVRGLDIPSVHISGYGPSSAYPKRIFSQAAKSFQAKFGWSPIQFLDSRDQAYLADHPGKTVISRKA